MNFSDKTMRDYFQRRLDVIRGASSNGSSSVRSPTPLIAPALKLAEEMLREIHGRDHYELSVWTSPEAPEIVAYYDSSGEERPRTYADRVSNPLFYREKSYEVIRLLDSPATEPMVIRRPSSTYVFVNSEQRERIKSSILLCFDVLRPAAIVVTSDRPDCFADASNAVELLRCVSLAIRADLDLVLPKPAGERSVGKCGSKQFAYSWVHLSDVHFGAGSAHHRLDQRQVADAVLRDLKRLPAPPDAIFVTGDLAYRGASEEYVLASTWIKDVAAAAAVDISSVRLVPGNHDVQRDIEASNWRQVARTRNLDEAIEKWSDTLLARFGNYVDCVRQLVPTHPVGAKGKPLDWMDVVACSTRRGPIRIALVGLSTVWISDEHDGLSEDTLGSFSPNLCLCVPQFDVIRKARNSSADLLLLLTHHPPEWLSGASREQLEKALNGAEYLHLCGHIHVSGAVADRRFGSDRSAFRFSAGAAHDEEPKLKMYRGEHGYSWGGLRVTDTGWQLGWAPRVYVPLRQEFRADRTRYDLDPMEYDWQALTVRAR